MIKYTDYAFKDRQEKFLKQSAKKVVKPIIEDYEVEQYQPAEDTKIFVFIIIGIFVMMSLFLVATQAKSSESSDCMPISPMSLVDAFGGE